MLSLRVCVVKCELSFFVPVSRIGYLIQGIKFKSPMDHNSNIRQVHISFANQKSWTLNLLGI